jgi:hypothetical protein
MGGEHIFDLEGRNILRVADDRIPDATGNADVAVCIDQPEIARAQPAVLVERVGVQCGVGVAEKGSRDRTHAKTRAQQGIRKTAGR